MFLDDKGGNVGTCPYYRHCWANEPQTDEYEDIPVYDDDTMTSLMEDYLDVSHEYSILQSEVKQYKQKKKELEKVLSKNLDFRDTDIVLVGNTRLKRTKVKGRTYLKPERAYKQGLISEQAYQKIREVSDKSSGYERFYTKQINRRKKDE